MMASLTMMGKHYDLIVFDWDGTVADSTTVIVHSIQAACRGMDLPVPDDKAARHVIGLGLEQALRQVVPSVPDSKIHDLIALYRRHFIVQSETISLYDGARETIIELHDAGYLLAIATGMSRKGLERALNSSGLKSYFHGSRTADVTFSKPNPAMLLELMGELGVDAERTLMVGDTTHDLLMAQNANVDAVAVMHGAHMPEQLEVLKPLAMVEDFTELRTWLKTHARQSA